MKRILLITIILILSCGCLVGCGKRIKTQDEIKKDVEYDPRISECINNESMTINEFYITKRQTNKEDKIDYVYVYIKASNENFVYEMAYKLIYALYNDGWHLDYVAPNSRDQWRIEAIRGIDEQRCKNDYMDRWHDEGDFELQGIDFYEEAQRCSARFIATEKEKYRTTYYSYEYTYDFDPQTIAWELVAKTISGENVEWDIEGVWTNESNDESLIIEKSDDSNAWILYYYTSQEKQEDPRGDRGYVFKDLYSGMIPKEIDSKEGYAFVKDRCIAFFDSDGVTIELLPIEIRYFNSYVYSREKFTRIN